MLKYSSKQTNIAFSNQHEELRICSVGKSLEMK